MNWNQRKRTQLIAIVFLLVLVLGYVVTHPNDPFSINFVDNTMVLSSPDFKDIVVKLGSIENITFTTAFDIGNPVSGEDTYTFEYGEWQNSELGNYTLCAHAKVQAFIIVRTNDDIIVFNEGLS